VVIYFAAGVKMKWLRNYVFHANWKTPWGVYFASRANGKLLEALPGYNEINNENKRLIAPAFLYLFIFVVVYYAIIVSLNPITISTTEYCYSAETSIEVECPAAPTAGLCDAGKILTNIDDEWWCVDPEDKQLGIPLNSIGCGIGYKLSWDVTNWVCREYPPQYGEIGNPLLEDPNCRLVERSNLGDLYTC